MKKCTVSLLSLVIALSIGGFCFAQEKETERADKIKQAQECLMTLGYYKGEATGKMNPETRAAIREFEKKEMEEKMPSGMLNEKNCDMICKKADEKKAKDKEGEKGIMDKAKEKVDEGKSKMMPDTEK